MTKINFMVLSRAEAEAEWVQAKITEPHILISIYGTTGTDALIPSIPDNENRADMLQICFDDIDAKDGEYSETLGGYKMKYFSEDRASDILDFTEKNINKVNLIVVHCFAGVCRSVACASSLSKILNNEDDTIFKSGVPNMLVYKTILEKFWLCDYNILWPNINELNFKNTEHYR